MGIMVISNGLISNTRKLLCYSIMFRCQQNPLINMWRRFITRISVCSSGKKVNVPRGGGGALMPAATCKVLRVRWEIYSKSMSIWNGIKHRVKINILHLIKHVVYEYDSKANTSKCINGLRIRQAKEAKPFEQFMWYMSQNRVHNRAPSTLYTSNWNVCSYFRHSSIALLTHIRLTVTFCRSTRLNSILLFMKRAHKQNALHSATLILPLLLVPFSRSFYYYPEYWTCK